MGGREVNMINTLSKTNLSKIGWEVNLNLDNVFKYTVFLEITPYKDNTHGEASYTAFMQFL